jgi:hypothetical protein
MPKSKRRFTIGINEGAFFHEPWLHDGQTNQDYRYDKVPRRIKMAFAVELRERGKMSPEEAAMIVGWIEHGRL